MHKQLITTTAVALLYLGPALCFTGCSRPPTEIPELAGAIALIRDGAFASALVELDALAAVYTNAPAVFANQGIAFWRLGQTEQAVPALSRAATLAPTDQRLAQLMARIFIERRNTEGALAVLDEVSRPTARTLAYKAMAHYRAGRTEQALIELNRALDLSPHYPPVLYNLAVLHRDARLDAEAALRFYEAFKAAVPTHHLALRSGNTFVAVNPHLAEALSRTDEAGLPVPADDDPPALAAAREAVASREYDAAIVHYQEAVTQRPDRPDALWEMAEVFDRHLGFSSRAEELRRRFKRMFPDDPRGADIQLPDESAVQRAQAHFDEGMAFYQAGQWVAASAAFRRAMELDAESAGAAYNLGLTEKERGNTAAAVAAFEMALQRDPEMSQAQYMIGLVDRERGNIPRAVAQLNQLLRRQPDYAPAHVLLALIYIDNARQDLAAAHFEQYLAIEPEGGSSSYARAWLQRYHPENE